MLEYKKREVVMNVDLVGDKFVKEMAQVERSNDREGTEPGI